MRQHPELHDNCPDSGFPCRTLLICPRVILSKAGRFSELFPLKPRALNHPFVLPHVQKPHKVLWCNISLDKNALFYIERYRSTLYDLKNDPSAPFVLNVLTTLPVKWFGSFLFISKKHKALFQEQRSPCKDRRVDGRLTSLCVPLDSTFYSVSGQSKYNTNLIGMSDQSVLTNTH